MLLRASAAPRWMSCAASAWDIPGQLSDEDTEEAMEGTCAAWVAEQCINNRSTDVRDFIGQSHPENGWIVDADMARHIEPYVKMALGRVSPIAEVSREIQIGSTTLAGTSDLWSFAENGSLFCIDDLKYGYDIIEPRSWQLGVYMTLAIFGDQLLPKLVRLGIYQPRALHPDGIYRTLVLNTQEINEWCRKIYARVETIDQGARDAESGDHCPHCPKAAMCEAITHSAYRFFHGLTGERFDVPTGQQLTDEYDFLERAETILKARKTAVHAEVNARLDGGKFVPGLVREQRPGKRKFKDHLSSKEIKMLTGVNAIKADIVTPAELERRGANPDLVKRLTYTPNTGRALTRVTPESISKKFQS
jgi:hypothetical protein